LISRYNILKHTQPSRDERQYNMYTWHLSGAFLLTSHGSLFSNVIIQIILLYIIIVRNPKDYICVNSSKVLWVKDIKVKRVNIFLLILISHKCAQLQNTFLIIMPYLLRLNLIHSLHHQTSFFEASHSPLLLIHSLHHQMSPFEASHSPLLLIHSLHRHVYMSLCKASHSPLLLIHSLHRHVYMSLCKASHSPSLLIHSLHCYVYYMPLSEVSYSSLILIYSLHRQMSLFEASYLPILLIYVYISSLENLLIRSLHHHV